MFLVAILTFLDMDSALAAQPGAAAAGLPAAPTSPVPAPKVYAQVYGDWIYRCISVPQSGQIGQPGQIGCEAVQQMVLNQNGKSIPLMTLAFLRGPNQADVMNIVAPLGVLLQPGIALSVGAGKPILASYAFCTGSGCWSIDQPANGLIKEFHGGQQGHARIALLNGHTVTINFSLSGAGQALAALDSGIPPAHEIVRGSPNVPAPKPAS